MASGNISSVDVSPISSINVTTSGYKPTNTNHSYSGSAGGGSSSNDLLDLSNFVIINPELKEYEKKEQLTNLNEVESTPGKERTWLDDFLDSQFFKVVNTYGNFWLAMNDGAISLTEKIADGAIWSTKATMAVIMTGGNKFVSLFNPDFAKELDAGKDAVDGFFKDVISFSVTNWWRDMLNDTDFMEQVS